MGYTKHWGKKMKTIFRHLDLDHDGYLTYSDVERSLQHKLASHPELDVERERQQQRKVWIDFYNGGQEVPDDYRLSEADFLTNMWKAVKEPAFSQAVNDMATKTLEGVDAEKKGYVSKTEYVKVAGRHLGLDRATAAFDSMDVKKSGRVTHKELVDALLFYYTDTDDEASPLNYMKGPLVD